MAKYRSIPQEVEAFRLGIDPMPDWFMDRVTENNVILHMPDGATVKTWEGNREIPCGDWFVRDGHGSIIPWKHSVFERTYETCG